MKKITGESAIILNQLFQTLLITYLVLLVMEQIWTGSVSTYLNLNWFLALVIILGVIDVFSDKPLSPPKPAKKKDYIFAVLLGLLGAIIIKYKTSGLDWLSWLLAITAGMLIILLSILILQEE